jgi:hypothetical protein
VVVPVVVPGRSVVAGAVVVAAVVAAVPSLPFESPERTIRTAIVTASRNATGAP